MFPVKSILSLCILSLMMTAPLWASQPESWQLGFQPPATELMEKIDEFHDFLMILITVIVVFVFLILGYCLVRFHEKINPEPSRVAHNSSLEIIWTIVPALILLAIAFPSYRILHQQLTIPPADIVIKVTGHQWYWEYEYVDENFSFDSNMIADDDLKEGQIRLLSVDNPIYVPAGKTVRIIVTASDVVHAFAVPAFGVKIDAIPGRLNESWFRVKDEGVYYGQCSELCGLRHAFMPIEVRVVADGDYQKWLTQAKKDYVFNGQVPHNKNPRKNPLKNQRSLGSNSHNVLLKKKNKYQGG